MDKILEKYQECMKNTEYETNRFMQPQIEDAQEILEFLEPEEQENFDGAPYAIRLSARGYMDCTEWQPIFDENDIVRFFDTFCEKD